MSNFKLSCSRDHHIIEKRSGNRFQNEMLIIRNEWRL